MDMTDLWDRRTLANMLGRLGGAVFWNPYSPSSSPVGNDNAPQYPSQATMLRNALDGHLGVIDALQRSLANTTDPDLANSLRTHLAITSQDAQSVRQRLQAATTPKLAGPGSGPPPMMPLMSPTMVTRPGSGGLFNEEEYLQRQRENLQPPGQGD
jgi:hypothetical protein